MKIVSIEPTPSPHSMKLNLDESLPAGVRRSYPAGYSGPAPDYILKLLAIPDVAGVFQTADFIAIDRQPKGDWERILQAAKEVLGVADSSAAGDASPQVAGAEQTPQGWGEVKVFVQVFRGIPLQVRVRTDTEERRAALPKRFEEAAAKAGLAATNLIMERKLIERGVRYGELEEVLDEVVRELDAAYDDERLHELVEHAEKLGRNAAADAEEIAARAERAKPSTAEELAAALEDADWRRRYAVLSRFRPSEQDIPLLVKALNDPHTSIRRLATVYLGDVESEEALPHLFRALKDPSASVRRTAGDTLSDIGSPKAIGPMAEALNDPNKLVRWRAARFLYEVGDESAVPALQAALERNEPEFEVRLQMKMALERIASGEAAAGTVWQQMTNRNK